MLRVGVELLAGTYRADPLGAAITDRPVGEWPPAPARLLAALIAADGPTSRTAPELAALSAAAPPLIYADPSVHEQPLTGRYVVRNTKSKNTHQEYVARKGALVRPGVRVSPRNRQVWFVYPGFDPDEPALAALRRRAARVGYLGCADSPVAVTIDRDRTVPPGPVFVPDPDGSVLVNTHAAGQVAIWCAAYDDWAERGANRARFPALRHQTAYRSPGDTADMDDGGHVLWCRFADTVPGRRVATVAHRFKQAAYSRYKQLHGEIPPAWFHGHDPSATATGWQLARFLPLPNVGNNWADGRIHGIAVWLPPDVDRTELRRVREAVQAVTHVGDLTSVRGAADRGDRRLSWAANPNRWDGPSCRWVTVFPAVGDRHVPVGSLDAGDVARWCRQAGLPAPVAVRVSKVPLIAGGVSLSRPETARPGHQQTRPWAHVEMIFPHKVPGPVAVGAARSYGLGLCAPVTETPGLELSK